MHDISRTLIIGLGGTGQRVILDIKKRLFQRYGEIPALVKFLSLDTDNDDYQDTPFKYYYDGENRETKKYNLQKDEFKKIGRPGIDVLKDDPICENLNYDELYKVYGLTNGIGACGFRIEGRARLLYNSGEIIAMLNRVVYELRYAAFGVAERAVKGYNVANNHISVYVVASLTGGMGSSVILDISRMLQHAGVNVQPMGAPFQEDRIFGMFFMPSFFKDKPNTPNIQINTYVTLSELDYTLGLNDRVRYPKGCEALERDKNDYDGYNTYQPVRYSNVYLLEADTRKGRSHDFRQATGYVASFIAASIAASAYVLDSCYSNSNHCMHDVDGKKQLYSGLGYCEIRLDRQSFVKYWLNRQLLELFALNNNGVDVVRLVDAFIEDHRLNLLPEVIVNANEVCSSVRGMVEVNRETREVDTVLRNEKYRYLRDIQASVFGAVRAFDEIREHWIQNFWNNLKECWILVGMGVFYELVEQLKCRLVNTRKALEEEVARCQPQMHQLEKELEEISRRIERNRSSFLFWMNSDRQRSLEEDIHDYRKKVVVAFDGEPTIGGLMLEITRGQVAIGVYDELIHMLEMFPVKADQICCAYRDLIDYENDAYRPSKAAKNETIFVDAYFKEYFENHPSEILTLSGRVFTEMNRYFGQLYEGRPRIDGDLLAAMRDRLLELLPEDNLIKRVWRNQISLDQLFISCFGPACNIADCHDYTTYPQLGLFGQLDALLDSLWQYEEFRGPNSIPVDRRCVVGVFDHDFCILDRHNGYGQFLPHDYSYQYINVGDPDKIVFMIHEVAIPAFVLKDAECMKSEYQKKSKWYCAFSDTRLEGIDMIFPE